MTGSTATVSLSRPLGRVSIIADDTVFGAPQTVKNTSAPQPSPGGAAQLQQHQDMYRHLCQVLQEAVAKLKALYEEIFAGHNEAITRLSVEIARKVLMRDINDGDYEIEAIIKEALQNAPENTELKIRLNPMDIETLHQLQAAGDAAFENVELIPDTGVGRAECVIESPKGIINMLINEHLERISNALLRTGQ